MVGYNANSLHTYIHTIQLSMRETVGSGAIAPDRLSSQRRYLRADRVGKPSALLYMGGQATVMKPGFINEGIVRRPARWRAPCMSTNLGMKGTFGIMCAHEPLNEGHSCFMLESKPSPNANEMFGACLVLACMRDGISQHGRCM